MAEIIDVKSGGQYECWLVIRDGKIFDHTENDGYTMMRRGPQATDVEINIHDVEALAQRYAKPDLVAQVKAALARCNV